MERFMGFVRISLDTRECTFGKPTLILNTGHDRVIPSQYIDNLEIYVNNQLGSLDRTTQYSDPALVMAAESQKHFMKSLLRMASNQRLISVNPDLGIREVSVDSQKLGDRQSAIQGPYLFQPVPHELEDSEGGDATDLIYVTSHGGGDQEGVAEINILCISFQDGKVDICLDLQKLEGKWAPANTTTTSHGSRTTALPVLHVYESVDIGRNPDPKQVPALNYPCFSGHPTLPDVVFIGHSFGIHCISMAPWTMELRSRLLGSKEEGFETAARHSEVILALSTVSDDQRYLLS
jgi:nucleoporin NUP82